MQPHLLAAVGVCPLLVLPRSPLRERAASPWCPRRNKTAGQGDVSARLLIKK